MCVNVIIITKYN